MADAEEELLEWLASWEAYDPPTKAPDTPQEFETWLNISDSPEWRSRLRKDRHNWMEWQWEVFLAQHWLDEDTTWFNAPGYTFDWVSDDLRFEDGDVLIKLSSDTKDWLLLHSHVLSAISPVIHAAFKSEWSSNAITMTHPISKREIKVFVLSLQYDANMKTCFLQSANHPLHVPSPGNICQKSCLQLFCRTGWAQYSPRKMKHYRGMYNCRCGEKHAQTIAHLKAFFQLFYDKPITLERLCDYSYEDGFDMVFDIIAYADLYLCLPYISAKLKTLIQNSSEIWSIVAEGHGDVLYELSKIAQAIRYDDLLMHCIREDATRHFGEPSFDSQMHARLELRKKELLSLRMGDAADDERFNPYSFVECLRKAIESEILPKVEAECKNWDEDECGCVRHHSVTWITNQNALETEMDEMPSSPIEMQANILAAHILREWCGIASIGAHAIDHTEVSLVGECDDPQHKEGSLIQMCQELWAKSKLPNPSCLVGETVAADYACLFSTGGILEKARLAKAIRLSLDELIKDAASRLFSVFNGPFKLTGTGQKTFRGNTIEHKYPDTFTYYPLYEDNVPWRNMPRWQTPPSLPAHNTTPASRSWLHVLGLKMGYFAGSDVKCRYFLP